MQNLYASLTVLRVLYGTRTCMTTQATGNDASTHADITAELNVKARRNAADALRRSPGVMKLIKTGIFKFDDFLTNGTLDRDDECDSDEDGPNTMYS